MRVVRIFFSPTGGTKRVMDMLTESLDGQQTDIDLADPGQLAEQIRPEDLAIIAMPSYGGRAPVLAMERFSVLQGHGAACLLVAVYGNRDYEDTLVELEDAAVRQGFRVIGAVAAVAEHSVVHCFAAGRPDEEDRAVLREAGLRFAEAALKSLPCASIPGHRPYTKPMSLSLVPKKTAACISCGRCRDACPAGAIDEHFIADKQKCISCMRCVGLCPTSARKPNAMMVKLSEMVLKKDCAVRKPVQVFLML